MTTMPAVVAALDDALSALNLSKTTITALAGEVKTLRRDIADRDGRIAELHAQLAAAQATR